MKTKFIDFYMDVAHRTAKLSTAVKLQVGAIIVKDNRIISIGYNGMPSGWTNECEYEEVIHINDIPMMDIPENRELVTKPEVIHAESNAISKLAKCSESGENASMFITHSPCMSCAKLIYQSGISAVYYRTAYRDMAGIDFLDKSDIGVHRL
jgi:dCMP deaminase